MKKSSLVAIFIVVACLQLAVPASRIVLREYVLQTGTEFRFRTAPVDPADFFRGRYVALGFPSDRVTNEFAADFNSGQSAYALITEDTNGFARVSAITADKPAGDNFFKTHVRYSRRSSVRFEYPFTRFYMKETLAPQAEKAYRDAIRRANSAPTYITVRVKMGLAVIEELYIEGVPVKEYLKQ
jgi:uncharacterized membrane-anchored protein